MVTDDERREVAKRLRELPTDMYEVEELWEMKGLDTCCKDQTDYYLIHFALFGCFPADHMHPCDYEELHARLADLIEPEPERTCGWVSVDDRLPDCKGEYIVAYHPCYWDDVDYDKVRVGTDSFSGKSSWAKCKYQRITHWMPKPEPPSAKVVVE